MTERVERAMQALQHYGLNAALLSSPHNVCYVSGYAVPIETGPSPFAGGPTLALLDAQRQVTLIVPDTDEAAARAGSDADTVVSYPAFSYQDRLDQVAAEAAALQRIVQETGLTAVGSGSKRPAYQSIWSAWFWPSARRRAWTTPHWPWPPRAWSRPPTRSSIFVALLT